MPMLLAGAVVAESRGSQPLDYVETADDVHLCGRQPLTPRPNMPNMAVSPRSDLPLKDPIMSTTCDARFIPNTPSSAPTKHDDGTPIKCTLAPNHDGAHADDSASTGETFEWRDLDARMAHTFSTPTIPFPRQTVRVLRAYARGFGVSLPSRLRKDDLVTLAQALRFGTRADAFAEIGRLGAVVDAVTFDRARTPVDSFDAHAAGTAPKPTRSTPRPTKPSTPVTPESAPFNRGDRVTLVDGTAATVVEAKGSRVTVAVRGAAYHYELAADSVTPVTPVTPS